MCTPCRKAGVSEKNYAKVGYVIFQLGWVIMAIIMLYTAKSLVEVLPHFLQCPTESGGGSSCMGVSAIIRMSFSLMCLHIVVFVLILARNDTVAIFHDGCWLLKNLFVFGFFLGMLYVPNSFFHGYASFARYVSVIFLFYQALLMLIVAYKINNKLVGNYDEEDRGAKCNAMILIGITGFLTVLNIIFISFQYKWFGGCAYNDVIISVTLIMSVLFYGAIFLKPREDASILTSTIVVSYILYLNYSALSSDPASCNPMKESSSNTLMNIIFGLFFTMISLVSISTSVKKTGEGNVTTAMNGAMMEDEEGQELLPRNKSVGDRTFRGKTYSAEEMHVFPISTATILFQALLVLSSVYYAMLLTNWGSPQTFGDSTDFYAANNTSYWVKLVAEWLTMAVYTFSLVAPLIFPDRQFG
jgi:hypothetical protein